MELLFIIVTRIIPALHNYYSTEMATAVYLRNFSDHIYESNVEKNSTYQGKSRKRLNNGH